MATYNYVSSTGTIIPDTAEIQEDTREEYREIFGDDFVTDDETPEGAIINAEVTSRQSVARNNAAVANQINPNLSDGIFLDAILALTGDSRTSAQPTIIKGVTLNGVPGTIINGGLSNVAQTTAGDNFFLLNTVILDAGGNGTGNFQSVENGPIEAGANTLTTIVTAVLGWETVNNPTAGVVGRLVQSSANAKNRRRDKLGLQGRSLAAAVLGNVSNVEGVLSAVFRENFTNSTQIIDGVTLKANSIWVNVDGGDPVDIVAALSTAKTGGAGYNGSEDEIYLDPESRQTTVVNYERPIDVNMLIRVTARVSAGTDDPEQSIREAVILYSQGEIENQPGFVIGQDVSPFEIGSAINFSLSNIFIVTVEVSEDIVSPIYQTTTFPISIEQVARITENNIQVILQ